MKKNVTLLIIFRAATVFLKKYISGFKDVNVKSHPANTHKKYSSHRLPFN